MNQQELRKEAAEKHAREVCGEYYDLMYEEAAIEYSMGQLCNDDFIAGAEWEAEREKWKSISELDLSNPIAVQRWHRMWNCPITVWFNKEDSSFQWYEKNLTNRWPEEAFMPFYCDLPTPPKTSKQ